MEKQASNFSELEKLNNIYNEACKYFSFDRNHIITRPIDCLTIGDLPPNGIRDNFESLSIYEDSNLVGFMTIYKWYPDKQNMYICFLYINNENRYKGFGKEIIYMITLYCKNAEFASIRVAVSLKNWNGIKFWNGCGFNNLIVVSTNGEFSDKNYGCIELEKRISATN
ncbi:GNAT family N-acetyltransferase [Clostridium chromiireducens]|uniref:GNAT family N-acetyltransferase n=1 Tax=Clostridium chromiireducens TaxID=225345 RepID=A0A964RS86_9CLOT|nr:GNAT family N-acetyltransferase [Clostridium chromiireducens]MVX66840.1 GNAT family N-acetyltransferase [Clostridium chromiireducens]